ncbi:MAG: GatB/YqeY domain-containing protein [Eubacteriales bacterium]|nr:GatB/YqeY domain-containing protein [Eubacteriales bacterium]
MSMIDEVRAAMVAAMKNKDKERKDSLSMLLSALKNKAIDKRSDLTEAEEFEVVKKEIKQTKETMELAPADREDIKEQCRNRLAVLQEFAPEEMSEEAIRAAIQDALKELGITESSGRDKGKVMKVLMPKVKGKADGALVNRLVSEALG